MKRALKNQTTYFEAQAGYMRDGLAETKKAADAATMGAQAARDSVSAAIESLAVMHSSERAYVTMSHYGGSTPQYPHTLNWPGPGFQGPYPGISFKIENSGNTPATVTDVVFGPFYPVGAGLPVPRFQWPSSPERTSIFLTKGSSYNRHGVLQIPPEIIPHIRAGQRDLWVIGHVDYMDMFTVRRRSHYARRYFHGWDHPGMDCLAIEGASGYNIDRAREPGEGNDWEEES